MQQGARPPGGKAAASHRSDAKRKATRNQPTSFYKGLAWDKHEGCWRVRVSLSGKQHHLGRHANEDHAAQVYDCAALLLFGEAAAFNFSYQRAVEALAYIDQLPFMANIRRLAPISEHNPPPPGGAAAGAGPASGAGPTAGAGAVRRFSPGVVVKQEAGAVDAALDAAPCAKRARTAPPAACAVRVGTAPAAVMHGAASVGVALPTSCGGPSGVPMGGGSGMIGFRLLAGCHSLPAWDAAPVGGSNTCATLGAAQPAAGRAVRRTAALRTAGCVKGAESAATVAAPAMPQPHPELQPNNGDGQSADSSDSTACWSATGAVASDGSGGRPAAEQQVPQAQAASAPALPARALAPPPLFVQVVEPAGSQPRQLPQTVPLPQPQQPQQQNRPVSARALLPLPSPLALPPLLPTPRLLAALGAGSASPWDPCGAADGCLSGCPDLWPQPLDGLGALPPGGAGAGASDGYRGSPASHMAVVTQFDEWCDEF